MTTAEMSGKIVLITGATSGIGRETALGLARLGATMVMFARNQEKAAAVIEEIKAQGNERADFVKCDLDSLDSVRKAADEFRTRYQRLDVLINNAGLISGKRKVTVDGYEHTFQVNHLSHFLLTNLLLDVLKKSAPSRIVIVSSEAHEGAHLDFDDLMLERRYSAYKAYGRSKLANILFCYELARRLEGTDVTANCLHPGVVRTNFGKGMAAGIKLFYPLLNPFMSSARKGASTSIYLASSPEVAQISGKYFYRRRIRRSSEESTNREIARRLWEVSERLAGTSTV